MKTLYRIGQIVPSSNITMETEIPAMLQARQLIRPERFAFHSSRMRTNEVSKDELASMDGQSDRCALELSDAQVDVMGLRMVGGDHVEGLWLPSRVAGAPRADCP